MDAKFGVPLTAALAAVDPPVATKSDLHRRGGPAPATIDRLLRGLPLRGDAIAGIAGVLGLSVDATRAIVDATARNARRQ